MAVNSYIPRFITQACTSCENCVKVCPTDSIFYGIGRFVIDSESCHGCGVCESVCPFDAIHKIKQPTKPDANQHPGNSASKSQKS